MARKPLPSWPDELPPQQRTPPAVVRAQVCDEPAAIALTPVRTGERGGSFREPPPLMPSWPAPPIAPAAHATVGGQGTGMGVTSGNGFHPGEDILAGGTILLGGCAVAQLARAASIRLPADASRPPAPESCGAMVPGPSWVASLRASLELHPADRKSTNVADTLANRNNGMGAPLH